MKRYVIGGGISALSFAFYNKDCHLICTKPKKFDNPFVFIHDDKYTRQLLDDLSLGYQAEPVHIYLPNSTQKILQDKRVGSGQFSGTGRLSAVSKNSSLKALGIRESTVCDNIRLVLEREDRISYTKPLSITDSHITFEGDPVSMPYSEIIYTEHFLKLKRLFPSWDMGKEISTVSLYYEIQEDIQHIMKHGSYVKYMDNGLYTRIVSNRITGNVGYELSPIGIAEFDKGNLKTDVKILDNARYYGKLSPFPDKILPVGRSATANPHWALEDSVFVAKYGYSLHKMLMEQRRYDWFIQNTSGVKGEKRIHQLILHAHSELSELLRETMWKMNANRSQKHTSILEEGIDVIKLVFAILHETGYTVREIQNMFDDKGNRNWEKTLNEFYGGI